MDIIVPLQTTPSLLVCDFGVRSPSQFPLSLVRAIASLISLESREWSTDNGSITFRSAIALALLSPVRLLNLIKHDTPECDRSFKTPLSRAEEGSGKRLYQIVSLLGGIFIQILW